MGVTVASDLTVDAMRKAVGERLRESVKALTERSGDIADGRDWEWAAPAAIDAIAGANSVAWVDSPYGFATLGNEEGFKEHVAELRTVATCREFGPVCVFRIIRPPIPTTCAHLFRSIRPPVTRCREAACFSYQA